MHHFPLTTGKNSAGKKGLRLLPACAGKGEKRTSFPSKKETVAPWRRGKRGWRRPAKKGGPSAAARRGDASRRRWSM